MTPAATAGPLSTTVPAAIELGWTMAVLYGPPATFGTANVDHLPTEHELDVEDRINVELDRLNCLLNTLESNAVISADNVASITALLATAWRAPAEGAPPAPFAPERRNDLRKALIPANVGTLKALACAGNEVELAYQVGRSFRDTANLPQIEVTNDAERPQVKEREAQEVTTGLIEMLGTERISTMQQWLATLAPHLPAHSASVVSTSVGRWSEMAGAALDPTRRGHLARGTDEDAFAGKMSGYLLRQGDVWLQLLIGTKTTDGLLDPEGYVAAGESALRRSTRIVLKVIRHYWVALVVLAGALAAVLALSAIFLGGAGKVWTQIAAIATSLGVTAKGIGSTTARLSKEAERPIFGLEEEDVMAWSITALPPVRLNNRGVRTLRRAGIAPSTPLLRPRSEERNQAKFSKRNQVQAGGAQNGPPIAIGPAPQ